MKFLKPSGFVDTIEYTTVAIQRVLRLGRAPQVYRLKGAQLSEPRMRLIQRNFA